MIKEAMLYKKLDADGVRCGLCAHRCSIALDKFGICGVRKNQEGKLYTLVYAETAAYHVDPIEKKPIYHFLPGSFSYSIATVGCNFKCSFCQNWEISQIWAPGSRLKAQGYELKPEDVVINAKKSGCKSISYTYTEPTIFFEYAYDTARLAKDAGLANIFVTNGYMTREALEMISPYLDAANVDLKSFRDDFYRNMCGACLEPVLDTIKRMKDLGIWMEITTLLVTGANDSDEELTDIAGFIAGVDPEMPWHISRFHPDFKYTDSPPTPAETLKRARDIGRRAGLKNIHLGNAPEI
ncbi:MAG: AmmeMemoRadiSam system radical SAM enzyme [Candidatus Omnitrophica bacterium]|nr:AmmeMemoRadiSam system radical SAM enzyme [Candidatus Omnitrophota bacterium]